MDFNLKKVAARVASVMKIALNEPSTLPDASFQVEEGENEDLPPTYDVRKVELSKDPEDSIPGLEYAVSGTKDWKSAGEDWSNFAQSLVGQNINFFHDMHGKISNTEFVDSIQDFDRFFDRMEFSFHEKDGEDDFYALNDYLVLSVVNRRLASVY